MFLQEFNPLTSFSLAALFYSVVLFIGVREGEKQRRRAAISLVCDKWSTLRSSSRVGPAVLVGGRECVCLHLCVKWGHVCIIFMAYGALTTEGETANQAQGNNNTNGFFMDRNERESPSYAFKGGEEWSKQIQQPFLVSSTTNAWLLL